MQAERDAAVQALRAFDRERTAPLPDGSGNNDDRTQTRGATLHPVTAPPPHGTNTKSGTADNVPSADRTGTGVLCSATGGQDAAVNTPPHWSTGNGTATTPPPPPVIVVEDTETQLRAELLTHAVAEGTRKLAALEQELKEERAQQAAATAAVTYITRELNAYRAARYGLRLCALCRACAFVYVKVI